MLEIFRKFLRLKSRSKRRQRQRHGSLSIVAITDRIAESLIARPDGLTRTQVNDLFCRHTQKERLQSAITDLIDSGIVEIFVKKDDGGANMAEGKPRAHIYFSDEE